MSNFIWPYKKDFQLPATPEMFGIINLHNHIMFIVVFIVVFVLVLIYKVSLFFTFNNNFEIFEKDNFRLIKNYDIKFRHNSLLEFVWTVIPTLILLSIVVPSFALLYSFELFDMGFDLVVKATGHQWYWSYEVCVKPEYFIEPHEIATLDLYKFKLVSIEFDSYMVPTDELQTNQPRLLATTEPLLIPFNAKIKLLVTSDDVLHSWAVPAFGCKMDACPGRLNQVYLNVKLEGTYYGQCSELCGVNHGFMPIEVRVVSYEDFFLWLCAKEETGDLIIVKRLLEHLDSIALVAGLEKIEDYKLFAKNTIYSDKQTITDVLEKSRVNSYIDDKKLFFIKHVKKERADYPRWVKRYIECCEYQELVDQYEPFYYKEYCESLIWFQKLNIKFLVFKSITPSFLYYTHFWNYICNDSRYPSSVKIYNIVYKRFKDNWYKI